MSLASLFINGIRIMDAPHMTIGPFEDWSQVRSRGRGARRRKLGHPQRIRFYFKPNPNLLHDKINDVIYGHPVTLEPLRQMLREPLKVGERQ